MKFKITYNKADTINKTAIVEADSGRNAVTVFQVENPNADVVKVEEVTANA